MVSIIIPVYNGENHILTCYKSLINQIYDKWEAIFVNDGSTDNSLKMLENLCNDRRVKIVNQENQGVVIARERGIKNASGDLIMFLDVDDSLEPEAILKINQNFDDQEIDIVACGFYIVSSGGKIIKKITYTNKVLNRKDAIDELCDGRIRWQLWAKAFRKELFQNIAIPVGLRSAEDMAVCLQLVLKCRKMKTIDCCLYNYLQIETSATHANACNIIQDNLDATDFLVNHTQNHLTYSNKHCLYLLNISSALRLGLQTNNPDYRKAIKLNFKLSALMRLPIMKVITLAMYRFLNINVSKYL